MNTDTEDDEWWVAFIRPMDGLLMLDIKYCFVSANK